MRAFVLAVVCLGSTAQASSLDRGLLRRVLQGGEFRRCYEAALRDQGPFEDTARLDFAVDARGTVTDVRVSLERERPTFEACLRDAGLKLHFPPGGPFRVVWPVVFKAR